MLIKVKRRLLVLLRSESREGVHLDRVLNDQALAACRVKLLRSESVELEAVSVTVRPDSDCCSQLSVKVTPFFSYTVTVGAEASRSIKKANNRKAFAFSSHLRLTELTWDQRSGLEPTQQVQEVSSSAGGGSSELR
ncbi:hypothetical protein CCH79_00011418 [Gambusia affinis]|uniref:Uncharacterized protein n=1 Tax=Gambusia affinis TaxID=33528 RepID=A0A315V5W4_GAMAF|nr:hypothetical protein CCH79_00011418 [Gambusia affinis]